MLRRNPDAFYLSLIVAFLLLLNAPTRTYSFGDDMQIRVAPLRAEFSAGQLIIGTTGQVIQSLLRSVLHH